MLLCVLSVCANDYTDKLTVAVNGVSMEQQATITIAQGEDGKYTFRTKNSGMDTVKSPIGLFETDDIDNDLKAVDNGIS